MKTKLDVYRACVLSVLLYGSETWAIKKSEINPLEKFHLTCIRWISGYTRQKQHDLRLSNEKLRKMCRLSTIEEMVLTRVLRCVGHVARMENTRAPKLMLFAWYEEGNRPIGNRKFPAYRDQVRRALLSREIDENIWVQLAQDRSLWRNIVNNEHRKKKKVEEGKGKGKGKQNGNGKGRGANNTNAGGSASSSSTGDPPPYEGALKCPFPGCGQWVNGKRGLSKHTAYVHTGGTSKEQGFTCDISPCTYHTPLLFTLNRHKSTQHVPGCVFCLYCKLRYHSPIL